MSQPARSARYFALIPAAGVGSRMAERCPKQYLAIAGRPMLRHSADAFLASPQIAHTFVVVSVADAYIDDVIPPALPKVTTLRCGGATRRDSVLNGLQLLRPTIADDDWVLVHDAARPGLTPQLIAHLIAEIGDDAVGGLLALPVVDTVKQVGADGVRTIPREALWLAQTPQMFRYGVLCRALTQATHVTDEASALEALGYNPKLVTGHPRNLKVTLPSDIRIAEMYLQE
ncbi:2-C-methyl-D-erythritol 4-phosphate cytidylyltransferase [Undibacterium arcticum]|uniref:2-C-methyl-D-erythritol 4-phosphate cytidylyltransferase n=1 Tax=Undibacterium arcticum TaxID=1762892 RepID=UPI003607D454